MAFAHARLLLAGAILAPGKRTVTSVLAFGAEGRDQVPQVPPGAEPGLLEYPERSPILLGQLLAAFLASGPVVVGIDETLERRWSSKLRKRASTATAYAAAIPTLSSAAVYGGSAWCCCSPSTGPAGCGPFLTALAPSARYARQAGKRHKKITDWARQLLLQLKRWLL